MNTQGFVDRFGELFLGEGDPAAVLDFANYLTSHDSHLIPLNWVDEYCHMLARDLGIEE